MPTLDIDGLMSWLSSGIVRQQIVAFFTSLVGFLGLTNVIDIDKTYGAILALVASLIALYTIYTRLFKPTPPITATAKAKLDTIR